MTGLVTRTFLPMLRRTPPRYVSYRSTALSRDVNVLARRALSSTPHSFRTRALSTYPVHKGKLFSTQGQENSRSRFPYLVLAASLFLGGGLLYTVSKEQKDLDLQKDSQNPLSNPELEKKLNSQEKILDLSGMKLSAKDLQELSEWLQTHTHCFMRIQWGSNTFPGSCVEMKGIHKALQNNLENFQERPSSYVCAQFCSLAYQSAEVLKQGGSLPDNWEFLDVQDTAKSDGYFGVAFVNHQTGQVVLSHRGTDQLFHDLQTDV